MPTPTTHAELRARRVRFTIALADRGYEAYSLLPATPANWAAKFEAAHGFAPPFTAGEMDRPWCAECCDFHYALDICSLVEFPA